MRGCRERLTLRAERVDEGVFATAGIVGGKNKGEGRV
jgi:hypothetical protein